MNKSLKRGIVLVCCTFLLQKGIDAQDQSNILFGEISPKDFDVTGQKFDSGANALIIADIGNTTFEVLKGGGRPTMVFTRFIRAKILNKNGFDVADFSIPLLRDGLGGEEAISEIEASTFNLDKGVVLETKLDKQSVFSEKLGKYVNMKKFTLPSLQAGSIFDVIYTVRSDFYGNIRPWHFQGKYPCLWSEYDVAIPQQFHYLERLQGDQHYDINTLNTDYNTFVFSQTGKGKRNDLYSLAGGSIQERMVKKNVPALKNEPFVNRVENYQTGVSYNLQSIRWGEIHEIVQNVDTWPSACEKLMKREDFGLELDRSNHWMSDELREVTNTCKTAEEKVKRIYCFIRDNFNCVHHDDILMSSSLKDVFDKKSGNEAEINLLLVAMLKHEKIAADPAILSTQNHGFADQSYPLLNQFNYVICVAHVGDKTIRLDASRPYNGFDQLAGDCYNGDARVIDKDTSYLIKLIPDSIEESKVTTVFVVNDDLGFPSGNLKTTLGEVESYKMRDNIKKVSVQSYFRKLQADYGNNIRIENLGIDSLKQPEYPVSIHYDFNLKDLVSADLVYFNPMLAGVKENNPFKSVERYYPVEMPFRSDQNYILNMEIPKGYRVDELPQSARIVLNGSDGLFEYLIQKNESDIQMRVRLKLNKAYFPVEEYTTLRDFFAYVVKKENEQIVFKKIRNAK